jgi:hypothetical protein
MMVKLKIYLIKIAYQTQNACRGLGVRRDLGTCCGPGACRGLSMRRDLSQDEYLARVK